MKLWFKRALAFALVAAGVFALLRHGKQLLDWPHLYPDLGRLGKENIVCLVLLVFALAMAWISAAYLLLNCEKSFPHFLIPAAAFALLTLGAYAAMTRAVGEIPCSYTDAIASCREEFDEKSFRVDGRALYPQTPLGKLSAYARYEKGEALAESITRSYEQEDFIAEVSRLQMLNVPSFRPPQDPREREVLCYQVDRGGAVWQVLVVPKTKTVTYSRFCQPEQIPDFAPQPSVPETENRKIEN